MVHTTSTGVKAGRFGRYAVTLFFSAFLLFQVQPLIGKFILPWFGGGPGVWTTCLLFFQAVLLGGYAYAHWIATRLTVRWQIMVHLGLAAVALVTLPILPNEAWRPTGGDAPIARILCLLTATIGAPYLVLSATGPLVQHWFGRSEPGVSPYRLYALSNAGSLLALVSYPFLFEPWLGRTTQAWAWSAGWVGYAGLLAWCARRVWMRAGARSDAVAGEEEAVAGDETAPTWGQRGLWMGLAATASIWLLATSSKLTMDVAPMPFLWVLPLGLYLLSFILCFDHPRWYRPGVMTAAAVFGIGVLCELLGAASGLGLPLTVGLYGLTLFLVAMVCHGELYRLRPGTSHLTAFYLWVSAGGAMGGLLVAVAAPLLLDRYAELQVGMWAFVYLVAIVAAKRKSVELATAPALGVVLLLVGVPALRVEDAAGFYDFWQGWQGEFVMLWHSHWKIIGATAVVMVSAGWNRGRGWGREWTTRLGLLPLILSLGFSAYLVEQVTRQDRSALEKTRNFYGTLNVFEFNEHEPRTHYHLLRHGGTTHGLQMRMVPQSSWPTTYYGELSGVGRAMTAKASVRELHVGVVGLGVGTMAAYMRLGDQLRFYEIDEKVETLARRHFTFLENTKAEVAMVLGDARLMLEAELARGEPQGFDVLVLDAFSSDSIPTHLLTREALEVYEAHLAEDGIIAVHISNRYLDLRPVVENLAWEAGLAVATIFDEPEEWWNYRTTWMLLARNREMLRHEAISEMTEPAEMFEPKVGVWTDDFSSLWPIGRW